MSTKQCPFCAETIQAAAIKCRYCGERLDGSAPPSSRSPYPPQRRWSPGIAAVLSFLIPGLGQLYKGSIGAGLLWFVAVCIGYVFLVIPGLILHLVCIFNAASGNPYGDGASERQDSSSAWLFAAGAALLLVAAIGGAWLFFNGGPSQEQTGIDVATASPTLPIVTQMNLAAAATPTPYPTYMPTPTPTATPTPTDTPAPASVPLSATPAPTPAATPRTLFTAADREAFAEDLRKSYLAKGVIVRADLSGPEKVVLKLTSADLNEQNAGTREAVQSLLDSMRAAEFEQLIIFTGARTWTYSVVK